MMGQATSLSSDLNSDNALVAGGAGIATPQPDSRAVEAALPELAIGEAEVIHADGGGVIAIAANLAVVERIIAHLDAIDVGTAIVAVEIIIAPTTSTPSQGAS